MERFATTVLPSRAPLKKICRKDHDNGVTVWSRRKKPSPKTAISRVRKHKVSSWQFWLTFNDAPSKTIIISKRSPSRENADLEKKPISNRSPSQKKLISRRNPSRIGALLENKSMSKKNPSWLDAQLVKKPIFKRTHKRFLKRKETHKRVFGTLRPGIRVRLVFPAGRTVLKMPYQKVQPFVDNIKMYQLTLSELKVY